jgi:P27 family predicted phage terminase small subunit
MSGKRGPISKSAKTHGVSGKLPQCPAKIGTAGKKLWKLLAQSLTVLHVHTLTQACKLADEMAALEKDIDEHGQTTCGHNGIEYLRPQVKQLNTAKRLMLAYEKELGLTPAADARLRGKPEPEEEEDELDQVRNFKAVG